MLALTIERDDFEQHRALLFAIAYRMVASAADAEDLVQEAHLRVRAAGDVRDPRAYLVTVITRLCLDHLKSARVRREEYVGAWLPEPLLAADGPDAAVGLRESASFAFLMLLDSLDPIERAVLVLHDVFDFSHAEAGEIVGKSEAASRQLLKRARDRLAEQPRRRPPATDEQQRLALRFIAATASGDVARVVELLTDDVVAYSDGGGKVAAAVHPIRGAQLVARYALAFPKKDPSARFEVRALAGQPAVLVWHGERLTNVFAFEFDGDHVATFYVQRNPDKLRRLQDALR